MTATLTTNVAAQEDFKPFVCVDLLEVFDLGSAYESGGEVLDVNEAGMAVGWVDDGTNRKPFFFDPNGFACSGYTFEILDYTDDTTEYEYVVATAISEPDPITDDIIVVGYAQEDYSTTQVYPCMWTIDYDGASGDITFFNGTSDQGRALDVNIEGGWIVGESYQPSYQYLTGFAYDIAADEMTFPMFSDLGGVTAVSDDGDVVGWADDGQQDDAYYSTWNGTTWSHRDFRETGSSFCQAYSFRAPDYIVGWYWINGNNQGAAKWSVSGQYWQRTAIGPGMLPKANSAFDVNNYDEVVIAYDDVNETSGAWLWYDTSVSGKSDNNSLTTLTLFPPVPDALSGYDDDPIMHRAYAINDNMWIAGSYKPDSAEGDLRPVLLIPYDIDNDGTPDIREILEGSETDSTSVGREWLIDWAEEMRVGLHAPGSDGSTSGSNTSLINNNQAVRLMMGISPGCGGGSAPNGLEDDEWINAVLDCAGDSTPCEDRVDIINDWTNAAGATQREIVFWVRSLMECDNEGYEDYDFLPDNSTDRLAALGRLRTFGYRFAEGVDYLQWGNEAFGGSGQYLYRYDDLSGQGCTWQGSPALPRELSDLPSSACKAEAVELVLDWIVDQSWAALQGSALRGRPTRMISPAITNIMVLNGYDEQPLPEAITEAVATMANRHQMAFDMHNHYDTLAQAELAINSILGIPAGEPATWVVPDSLVALEWGPQIDTFDTWWTGGGSIAFGGFFDSNQSCPTVPTPYDDTWEGYVTWWEAASQSFRTTGFSIDDVLSDFSDAGFILACYGPTLQHGVGSGNHYIFDSAALRADDIDNDGQGTYYCIDDTYQFTPLKDTFVTEAGYHQVSPFAPHSSILLDSEVCPDCN